MGNDNTNGQLGLGHTYPREYPELVAALKDQGEVITTIECGYKHVVAKSSLGRVYTWGWGGKGQLGHGKLESESLPKLLLIERNAVKDRVIQIAAGFSHTVLMIDNSRDLMWFGQCGHLAKPQLKPLFVKLSDHLPDFFTDSGTLLLPSYQSVDYALVKITASWSRNMSATNVLIADLRQVNT